MTHIGQGSAPVTRKGTSGKGHRHLPRLGRGWREPWPCHRGFLAEHRGALKSSCPAAWPPAGRRSSVCCWGSPGRSMGPSMSPTARAQRHRAERAGANPEHPPGTAPQLHGAECGPRQDRGAGAVAARSNAAHAREFREAMPGLGGPFGGRVLWLGILRVWGGQGTRAVLHMGGAEPAACCTNLRPGQLLALGQGQRLSLRPPPPLGQS